MANGIILHIVGKNNPDVNKVLHYSDGTVEVRTPDWKKVLKVYNVGREVTMLDMENQFLKIYEDATPKDKAKKLRLMAKELATAAGDIAGVAAIEAEEKEAAKEAAKAAKTRKKPAGDKRSATLFGDETCPREEASASAEADSDASDEDEDAGV